MGVHSETPHRYFCPNADDTGYQLGEKINIRLAL